jgi:hypothetical protein
MIAAVMRHPISRPCWSRCCCSSSRQSFFEPQHKVGAPLNDGLGPQTVTPMIKSHVRLFKGLVGHTLARRA